MKLNRVDLLTRKQDFLKFKGSIELASLQGVIASGEPHLHIAVCDENRITAGHLEDDCIVLTLAEIVILRADASMKRIYNQPEKIKQLTEK